MMLLVAKSDSSLAAYQRDVVGILTSPRGAHDVTTLSEGRKWAADNDVFTGRFNERLFVSAMNRWAPAAESCLFVAAPDVVGDAMATFDLFERWSHEIKANYGLPVALVAQDGMTVEDVEWWAGAYDALFIGGSTEWKLSPEAFDIVTAAKEHAWVHMGRVNSVQRIRLARSWGVDSVDGSSMSMFTDTHLPKFISAIVNSGQELSLSHLGGPDA